MKSWWKACLLVLFCLAILSPQGGIVLAKPVALDGDPGAADAQQAEDPNAWDQSALGNFPAVQPAQSETTTAPFSVAALPVGLVDYWKADEASGDLLGIVAGKTFTEQGSVGKNTGKVYATAREYDGPGTTGKHVRDNDDVRFGNIDFTVAVWWYQYETPAGAEPTLYHYIVQQDGYDGGYTIGLNGGFQLFFMSGRGENITDILHSPPIAVPNNVWHFAVCWYTAADHVLHTVIDGGTEITMNGGPRAIGTNPVYVGADLNTDNTMKGRIGPLMMWNRALTPAERWSVWNNGNGLTYAAMTSASPAAKPTISIANTDPTVSLTWHHLAGNTNYEVWQSPQPYFDPANPGSGAAPPGYTGAPALVGSTVIYPDTPTNPTNGAFYVVRGVNAAGTTSSSSNRVGVFTFAVTPGNP
jgi:hypothetical protein